MLLILLSSCQTLSLFSHLLSLLHNPATYMFHFPGLSDYTCLSCSIPVLDSTQPRSLQFGHYCLLALTSMKRNQTRSF